MDRSFLQLLLSIDPRRRCAYTDGRTVLDIVMDGPSIAANGLLTHIGSLSSRLSRLEM